MFVVTGFGKYGAGIGNYASGKKQGEAIFINRYFYKIGIIDLFGVGH